MKVDLTMKQVMENHNLTPKRFAEVSGLPYGTCRNISSGKKSPQLDSTMAMWLNFGLSHGKTIDQLKMEVAK